MRRSPPPDRAVDRALRSRATLRAIFARVISRIAPPGTRVLDVGALNREGGSRRFRLTLRFPSGARARLLIRGNIASADTAHEAVVANRVLRALAQRGFLEAPYQVPLALDAVPPLRLFLYEEVDGAILEHALERGGRTAEAAAAKAGAWLAHFHQTNLTVGRRRRLADVKREAGYFYDDVRRYAPRLLPAVVPLLTAAVHALEQCWAAGQRAARTIHGDYKPGNVLLRPGAVIGIDFGNSWVADPFSDVGNFLAQVRELGWRRGWPEARAERVRRAFLRRYGSTVPDRLAAHELWWHLQIFAYRVSTNRRTAGRIADRVIAHTSRLIGQLHLDPRPWTRTGAAFAKGFLADDRAITALFRGLHRAFFPGTDDLLALRVERPAAFSEDSRPLHLRLTLRLPNGRALERTVRGNRVGAAGITIYRRLFGRPGVRVPRPLWSNSAAGYLFYEELPGLRLREVPFRERGLAPIVRAVGRSLAAVQRVTPKGIPALPWPGERRFLALQARHLRASTLPQRARLLRQLAWLARWERRRWSRPPRVVAHNDFQASNILVASGRIGLIDFSRSGQGPLAIDAGQFLAHLTVMLAPAIGAPGRARLRRLFLAVYRAGLTATQRRRLDRSLPAFELRAALDIVGITCVHVRNPRQRDRILAPLLNSLPALPRR